MIINAVMDGNAQTITNVSNTNCNTCVATELNKSNTKIKI